MVPTEALKQAARAAGVRLLVLFGSRARDSAGPESDWDIAYLLGAGGDPDSFQAEITEALGTNDVDLADLARGSALLRYRVAAEGKLLYEASAGEFERFQIEATRYWCDVAPVLHRGYSRVLKEISST
jgi:uncharacterized protein